MIDLKNIELDITLHELIQNKPSSRLKLIAAWDGLSIETQVKIINILKEKLPLKIFEKTLSSTNEYVRFLSNKYSQSSDPFLEVPCDLASYLAKKSVENDCSLFFSMTHEKQILTISSWTSPKNFAGLVEWALENKPIEQIQLDELTEEFVHNESILNYFIEIEWDGWSAYEKGKELDLLWSLIPKLEVTKSAKSLVSYLPLQSGLSDDRSEEFLESLDPEILSIFLLREDVYFPEFRKKIFFSPDVSRNKYKLELQGAAAFCNLQLTAEELHTLIQAKNFDLLEELVRSNSYRPALSPALLCALCDIGNVFIEHYHYYAKDKEQLIQDFFKTRYAEDIDFAEKKIKDIIEVALYQIAVEAVSWNQAETEDDNTNTQYTTLGDLISKFLHIDESWKSSRGQRLVNFCEGSEFIIKNGDTLAIYMSLSSFFKSKRHLFDIPSKIEDLDSFIDDGIHTPGTLLFNLLKNKPENNFETDGCKEDEDKRSNQELNSKLDQVCEEIKKVKKELEFNNDMIFEKLEELKTTYKLPEPIQPGLNKFSQFAKGALIAFLVLIIIFQMK